MYFFYLDKLLFPIAPSKVQFKINGNNKTMNLINEGEVNQIKSPGLTDISFEVLIPRIAKYPFATYKDNKKLSSKHYLDQLEILKNKKTSIGFKISRIAPDGALLANTSMKVTLEDYSIVEEAKNGFDLTVSIDLKQYKSYAAKKLVVKASTSATVSSSDAREAKDASQNYTVKKGDTLKKIARSQYGTEDVWKEIYTHNKTAIEGAAKKNGRKSSSNGLYLYKGTMLILPNVATKMQFAQESTAALPATYTAGRDMMMGG